MNAGELTAELVADEGTEEGATGAETEAPARGYLLDAAPADAAKTLLDWWKKGEKARVRRNAIRLRNQAWQKGVRNVSVALDPDAGTWSVRYPLGGKAAPPQPNKLDDLLRGIVSAITADPVALEAEPQTDDQEDRDAAAFTTRMLKAEAAEGRLNIPRWSAEALGRALSAASDFTLVDIDPAAGGQQPVTVEAYAHAQTVEEATTPLPPVEQPSADPSMPPTLVPQDSGPLVRRYVAQDGQTLTDDVTEAQQMFVPAVVLEHHSPATIQFLPERVGNLQQAEGVMLGRVLTLGEAKRRFPEIFETATTEDIGKIVEHRPPRAKSWVPAALDHCFATTQTPRYADGTVADHALVFVLSCYMRACPAYPEGAAIHVAGETFVARQTLVLTRPDGAQETMALPVAQLLALTDPEGDPMGRAMADVLGPADEQRAQILAAAQEYCWRFGRPVQYVPDGSTLTPIDLARRDGKPLPFNAEGGLPVFEQIAQFPPTLWDVYDRLGAEMEQAAKLPPPAEGYASANIKSGAHMQRVLEQSQQQLSDLHQHTGDFAACLGRLIVQCMRAHYDVPRLLRFTTDEGGYEAKEWSAADLGTTADIVIGRGSFTMLPRTAKNALAQQELDVALKVGDPLAVVRQRRAILGNTSPLLGLEDDPHRRRVLRQLAQWKQGPPAELHGPDGQLMPPPPPVPQQQPVMGPDGMPLPDPMGQPMMQTVMVPQPDPVTVAASQCFTPVPADEEPMVARERWYEMSRVMATTDYETADPRWRAGFEQAYRATRQAAGVTTLAEQQAAQQQQQQMAQQAQQATAMARTAYAQQATAEAGAQQIENGQRMAA